MKFTMNNEDWYIKRMPQSSFWEYEKKEPDGGSYRGVTHYRDNEIWIDENLPEKTQKKVLYHELMHVYIATYISLYEFNITEELLCDISANSHDIIHDIVERYFSIERKTGFITVTDNSIGISGVTIANLSEEKLYIDNKEII